MENQSVGTNIGRATLLATAIAGTLDIGMAAVETAMHGKPVGGMLRGLASGAVPPAPHWGAAGALLGLIVHYAIMAVMAFVFISAHRRNRWVHAHSLLAGAIYGLGLYLFMYGLVLPLRFGATLPSEPIAIAKGLFAHVVLVGLTFGLVARSGTAR
jgi:hypothetical protein